MADKYMDWTNGNNSNDGSTFALRVQDMLNGATGARTPAGTRWKMMKTEDPVSLGINATFTNLSDTVTLASALTANIDTCEGAWTAVSANVTQSNPTTRKEGSKSIQFAIAAAFTTGQIAYHTMASTDFSAYQKVSFWIKPSASVATGVLQLLLCTDTLGTVVAQTITINQALSSNTWTCITVDTGGALSAAVQSISFNALSDPGTVNVRLDNILACNNLTLTSVISLNSSATTLEWYPVKSINGTTVKIDSGTGLDGGTTGRGFYGTTATSTCYKIEPVRITTSGQKVNNNGSLASPITFSGGWDTTNMTSQTGLTFLDLGDQLLTGIQNNESYINFENIVLVRGNIAWYGLGGYQTMNNCAGIGCGYGMYWNSSTWTYLNSCRFCNCNNYGIYVNAAWGYIANCYLYNNQTYGITQNGNSGGNVIVNTDASNNGAIGFNGMQTGNYYTLVAKNNGSYGFASNSGAVITITGITTSGNGSYGVASASPNSVIYIDNASCSETNPFSASNPSRIQVSRIGDDPTQVNIYDSTSTTICIQIDTGTVHGSATKSYKHSPQSGHISARFPLIQKIGKFAVDSSGTLTVSIWVQRDSTNIVAQLLLRGGQVDGVASDLTAVASAAVGVWEQLTITCSPTQKVPVHVELQTWQNGGSGNAYFSDASVSQ